MCDDPAAADAFEAALERNRGRNVRHSLYTPRGEECIEGSLRRVGATRHQRRAIAVATRRHGGHLSHVEVNDNTPDLTTARNTLRRVVLALRGTPKPTRIVGVDDALAVLAVAAVVALAVWAPLVLAAAAVVAVGVWVGHAVDYDHLVRWCSARRAQALARRRQRDRLAAAREPIALGPVPPVTAQAWAEPSPHPRGARSGRERAPCRRRGRAGGEELGRVRGAAAPTPVKVSSGEPAGSAGQVQERPHGGQSRPRRVKGVGNIFAARWPAAVGEHRARLGVTAIARRFFPSLSLDPPRRPRPGQGRVPSTTQRPGRPTMANDTVITLIGNLTADPELRFTPSGAAVANFTVASTPRTFDRQSGEWRDGDALFLRCNIWRQPAENVAETLTRGARVIVQGRLKQRSFETREGEKRTVIELEVDEIGPSLRYATATVTKASRSGRRRRLWWRAPRGPARRGPVGSGAGRCLVRRGGGYGDEPPSRSRAGPAPAGPGSSSRSRATPIRSEGIGVWCGARAGWWRSRPRPGRDPGTSPAGRPQGAASPPGLCLLGVLTASRIAPRGPSPLRGSGPRRLAAGPGRGVGAAPAGGDTTRSPAGAGSRVGWGAANAQR